MPASFLNTSPSTTTACIPALSTHNKCYHNSITNFRLSNSSLKYKNTKIPTLPSPEAAHGTYVSMTAFFPLLLLNLPTLHHYYTTSTIDWIFSYNSSKMIIILMTEGSMTFSSKLLATSSASSIKSKSWVYSGATTWSPYQWLLLHLHHLSVHNKDYY